MQNQVQIDEGVQRHMLPSYLDEFKCGEKEPVL
jgi:hypothetical protein